MKTDLHKAIISRNFIIGIVAAIAVMLVGSIGMVSPAVTAVLAFQNSYCYNNVIDLMFIADGFVYASSFAKEWQSRYHMENIVRCSPTAYALSKCVATAISSGLSISLGIAVYITGLCIHQPVLMPSQEDISISVTTFKDLLLDGHMILFFLAYLYVIFLQAMFFSMLGLLASGFFPNKYVAYCTPFVAGFAMNQLTNSLNLPNWMDPVKLALARVYGTATIKVILVETSIFLLLTAVCSALFICVVKRRIANE